MNDKLFYSIISILIVTLVPFSGISQNEEPVVSKSIFHGKSKPVREMNIVLPGEHVWEQPIVPNVFLKNKKIQNNIELSKRSQQKLQRHQGYRNIKGPILSIDGIENVNNSIVADPNGDVSKDYFIQTVNSSFAVWDNNGNLIYGPVDYQTLWDGFPGPWTDLFWGDPIFKYDRLADRWVISTMSINFDYQSPYFTMVAVSETSDPLGAYHCYAFEFEHMNDYPKLSVWPDAYYITHNIWDISTEKFYGSQVSVFDRAKMLVGVPDVTMIEYQLSDSLEYAFSPLPADFNGTNLPGKLDGYVASLNKLEKKGNWTVSLDIYACNLDWENPFSSTIQLNSQIFLGEFAPVDIYLGPGAPQPINNTNVSTLIYFLMYPLTYRNFGEYEVMTCCFTAWNGEVHSLKWLELRKEDQQWDVYQQGNYAPDNSHRYQPSIAINGNGDIAMGYTVSDEETFPSIRMTGRRANDSLGVMTFQELELFKGLNYINTYHDLHYVNRWGDYASMMVDPANDSTFWLTNMYPKSEVTERNWGTRIFAIDLNEEFEQVTSFAGNDTAICKSDITFITKGTATNYNAIQWTTSGDGTFLVSNTLNANYILGNEDKTSGDVQLVMTVSGYGSGNIAVDTLLLFIDDCSGIEEFAKDCLTMSVNPNPIKSFAKIKCVNETHRNTVLQVHNLQGQIIFTENIVSASSNFERTIDFSYKEDGIYHVVLKTANESLTVKIIKIE